MATGHKLRTAKQRRGPVTALAHLFSPRVFHELGQKGWSAIGAGILREAEFHPVANQNLGDFLGDAYRELSTNLRSEYVFKNAIAERILLGKHTLNTAAMLTEFRAGTNKADAVVLNGTSTVYEIKSERDKLCRLEGQLDSYVRIFEKVVVVADECHRCELLDILPRNVGLMVLSDRYQFSSVREPRSNFDSLEQVQMFESLQRAEYIQILARLRGWEASGIPNGIIHDVARMEFSKLSIEQAHESFVQALRNRALRQERGWFIHAVPKHLKAIAVSLSLKREEQDQILEALQLPAEIAFAI